jgi:hypothetical protein
MGGMNSGSRARSGTLKDDQLHRLDIHEVRSAIGERAFSRQVEALRPAGAGLSIQLTGDDRYTLAVIRDDGSATIPYGLAEALSSVSPRQFVPLAMTKPRFGGARYWFRCPRSGCGCRCSVLYREEHSNARAFACRKCIRFRYRTQVLGDADVVSARMVKLLTRLDVTDTGEVRRPKGMHSRTFRRIANKLDAQAELYKKASPFIRHAERTLAQLKHELASA